MAEHANSGRSSDLRSIGALLLFALMLVGALRSTRVPEAVDLAMRSLYYRVAPSANSTQRVLLVEADEETVAAEPPVWAASRRQALLARIARGHPTAVVELDRGRMFAAQSGDVVDPILPVTLEPRIDPSSMIVESLDTETKESLEPVFDALRRSDQRPDEVAGSETLPGELAIHYLPPTSRLPTVSFQRIEQDDVMPSSVFQDKVVVIGLTAQSHRDLLPTPVGGLTTPEIISHALAMMADGRNWYQPSWLVRTLGLALVLIGTALVLWRTTPAQAVLRVAAVIILLVLADLGCFVMSWMHWGVANEILVVLTVMLANWYLTQQQSVEIMETVSDQLTEQLEVEPAATTPEDWFWRDMAELVRAYLRVELDGVIAELPPARWHLELRAFMGMSEDDIGERRRDVRRPPYRSAFLTQRIARCDRYFGVNDDHYTMAVPLAYQGRLYGMWLVCVPKDMELDGSEIDAMERLGAELGRSIAAKRRSKSQGVPTTVSGADVSTRLTQLVEGVEALGEDKQQVVGTFEALPVGLLIADVWGHILQINAALREQLATELPDGIPNNDLCAVLSKITGNTIKGVHDIMRTVVRAGKTCRLRPRVPEQNGTTYVLMPMRNQHVQWAQAAQGTQGLEDDAHTGSSATRLVLVAIPNDLESLDMLIRSA